jgi:hypothetical protein
MVRYGIATASLCLMLASSSVWAQQVGTDAVRAPEPAASRSVALSPAPGAPSPPADKPHPVQWGLFGLLGLGGLFRPPRRRQIRPHSVFP